MITFKQFLLEYLTDEQRKRFAHIKMSKKARADTDHFFGKGNDIVHGEISTNAGHIEHKSEVHRAVERHLGQEIHHDDYRRGIIKDKYGRDVKIGRLIKDEKLRNAFASDSTREGSRKTGVFKTSTVRGVEVAGQSNSAPDPHHPKGHSWGELSCKNVDTGSNRSYLRHEIRHGTVVHRVHDHTGQEIYRATLQPHHNEEGHVAYAVDSEYGIKNPAFTKSAHEVAKSLSGEYKSGIFKKHPEVYNNNGIKHIIHPKATHEDILRALNDENFDVKIAAINHPNINDKHLHKALNDKYWIVRKAAASHPNVNAEHLHKALNDGHYYVRKAAASNLNANAEHLYKALNDKDFPVREAAASNQNANTEHLHKALNDHNTLVRAAAASNPNANAEHLHKALNDEHWIVRESAANHPNANAEHLHKALNDKINIVKYAAINNPNVNAEHLNRALNDKYFPVREAAASNQNANAKHIHKALNDHNTQVRAAAASNPNANAEHLHKALNDEHWIVRESAAKNPNANKYHLERALNDENERVRKAAKKNPNYKRYFQ
jgi:2-oxo-4-hydroxy-4-carboxy--5-ureidoimidazoline (OHCU) decarboxylase